MVRYAWRYGFLSARALSHLCAKPPLTCQVPSSYSPHMLTHVYRASRVEECRNISVSFFGPSYLISSFRNILYHLYYIITVHIVPQSIGPNYYYVTILNFMICRNSLTRTVSLCTYLIREIEAVCLFL